METGDVVLRGKVLYRRALAYRGLKQVEKAIADLSDPSLKEDKVRCGPCSAPIQVCMLL
jgi:hypothetical protein